MDPWRVALWSVAVLAVVPALYGLHRLCLWLEARGHLYYWHRQPGGGSGSNVFQEIIEPTARHVQQVREQKPPRRAEGGGE